MPAAYQVPSLAQAATAGSQPLPTAGGSGSGLFSFNPAMLAGTSPAAGAPAPAALADGTGRTSLGASGGAAPAPSTGVGPSLALRMQNLQLGLRQPASGMSTPQPGQLQSAQPVPQQSAQSAPVSSPFVGVRRSLGASHGATVSEALPVEDRVASVEVEMKKLAELARGASAGRVADRDGESLPALKGHALRLGQVLLDTRSSRREVESRVQRLESLLTNERSQREAWLSAFQATLRKTLGELSACVERSMVENDQAMSVRLDQSEALVQRLVARVDGRCAAGLQAQPRSGTPSMSSFRTGAISPGGSRQGGSSTPGGILTPGGTGAPAPHTVGGFCAGAAQLRAAGLSGTAAGSRPRSLVPSEGGDTPSGLRTPESQSGTPQLASALQRAPFSRSTPLYGGSAPSTPGGGGQFGPANRVGGLGGIATAPSTPGGGQFGAQYLAKAAERAAKAAPAAGGGAGSQLTGTEGLAVPGAAASAPGTPGGQVDCNELLRSWNKLLSENLRLQQRHTDLVNERKNRTTAGTRSPMSKSPGQRTAFRSMGTRASPRSVSAGVVGGGGGGGLLGGPAADRSGDGTGSGNLGPAPPRGLPTVPEQVFGGSL